MKKLFLIIGSCLFVTTMSCIRDTDDSHYNILFHNEADYDVFIEDGEGDYYDTSLSWMLNVMTPGWHLKVESHCDNIDAFFSWDTYESILKHDTLMVFVFNADTLSTYGWDYAKEHYMVAQRYDLSLSDLQNLNWRLTFPPTEEMRNMKMWPSYGTYDEHGNRLK